MKSKEEIEQKIESMKKGLEQYVVLWESELKVNSMNGLPIQIENDTKYNIVKNQIEALEWVLKDK